MLIADIACATILETRKFESSKRIEVLNKAREKVGDYDGPYSLGDDFLWTSLTLGGKQSCIDKIIEPPPPPPKTKAELETEAAAAEARAKREEEKRLAKEKAKTEEERIAKERVKYIDENIKTTHLYCPSVKIAKAWEVPEEKQSNGEPLGPTKIALVELEKITGEKDKLDELGIKHRFWHLETSKTALNGESFRFYPNSRVYFDIYPYGDPYGGIKSRCRDRDRGENVGYEKTADGKVFCIGKVKKFPREEIFDIKGNDSYGNSILNWGGNFILDRVTLEAADNRSALKSKITSLDSYYQCEIVTKSFFDKKLQEVRDKVKVRADAYRATLKEKQSQELQI
jgi:hypothetical protein